MGEMTWINKKTGFDYFKACFFLSQWINPIRLWIIVNCYIRKVTVKRICSFQPVVFKLRSGSA